MEFQDYNFLNPGSRDKEFNPGIAITIVMITGLQCSKTYPPCSKNVCTHSLLCRSQTFTVLSSLPDTMSRPSGENLPLSTVHCYDIASCMTQTVHDLWKYNYVRL